MTLHTSRLAPLMACLTLAAVVRAEPPTLSDHDLALQALGNERQFTVDPKQPAKVLRIKTCTNYTSGMLRHLGSLAEIRELSFRLDKLVTSHDLLPLRELVNLESFVMHHTGHRDACLVHLSHLPKLKSIRSSRGHNSARTTRFLLG